MPRTAIWRMLIGFVISFITFLSMSFGFLADSVIELAPYSNSRFRCVCESNPFFNKSSSYNISYTSKLIRLHQNSKTYRSILCCTSHSITTMSIQNGSLKNWLHTIERRMHPGRNRTNSANNCIRTCDTPRYGPGETTVMCLAENEHDYYRSYHHHDCHYRRYHSHRHHSNWCPCRTLP